MQKLAIYGKGGIGKSTLSANLSVAYAKLGKRVLHIGCDPKHDSTLLLTNGTPIQTVAEQLARTSGSPLCYSDIVTTSAIGIDCIESGGPEPGVGCGGWVISRMIDVLQDDPACLDEHDMVLFDVLGDVVCGGFANPLRQGYANEVVIVLSEELLSIFAANNIAKMIARFYDQGIRLRGLVVNQRDNHAPLAHLSRFAEKLSTNILAILPRDGHILEAERNGVTITHYDPKSPFSCAITKLAELLIRQEGDDTPEPTPMDDRAILAFLREIEL